MIYFLTILLYTVRRERGVGVTTGVTVPVCVYVYSTSIHPYKRDVIILPLLFLLWGWLNIHLGLPLLDTYTEKSIFSM